MKFLTEEQLEKYYNCPIGSISPTDKPNKIYQVGNERFNCLECGEQLSSYCTGTCYIEKAYCDNCEIEFERIRKPICEALKYQQSYYRTDEREEYLCKYCHNRHPLTVPSKNWNYITKPNVTSYETIHITCSCGEIYQKDQIDLPLEIDCTNCSRKIQFIFSSN